MIKRHHPITVIYGLYSQVRYSIIPFAIFLFNEIRSGTGQQPYWIYYIAAVYGIATGCWSICSWYKATYQLDSKALHLTSGVFTVTQRTIPLSKISNMLIKQSWIYRLLRIAAVELQTSDSNAYADAYLVTSSKMAEKLKESIGVSGKRSENSVQKEHTVTPKEIMMLCMSSNTFWLGVPVTLTLIQLLWSWLFPKSEADQVSAIELFEEETWQGVTFDDSIIVVLYLLAFLGIYVFVTWLVSLGLAQFRYKGWHIARIGDEVLIRHGWTEQKTVQIQAKRIQALRIKERMFGRLFGYVSVCMDCVGYRGERRVKLLIPSIRISELDTVLVRLLPEFHLPIPKRELKHNAKYHILIPVLSFLAICIVIGCYINLWFIATILLLFVASAYIKYIYDQTTIYLMRESTESISIRQSWWQRLFHMYQVEMDIDSPERVQEYRLIGISKQNCDEILDWYKNKSR